MLSKSGTEEHGGVENSSFSSKSELPLKHEDYREKEHLSAVTLGNGSEHDVSKSLIDDSSDTATNSSDEFDWDAEDDVVDAADLETKRKTRRGRKIYGFFMRLARPVRTALIAVLGAGVFISPLLIFQFRFHNSVAQPHVHAWSLWLSISWAAASVTYLVVDLIPRFIILLVTLFHGQVENLKTQLEVLIRYNSKCSLLLTSCLAHLRRVWVVETFP